VSFFWEPDCRHLIGRTSDVAAYMIGGIDVKEMPWLNLSYADPLDLG